MVRARHAARNRRRRGWTVATLVAQCALLAAAPRAAHAQSPASPSAPASRARIEAVTGEVEAGAGTERPAARAGQALEPGARVVTRHGAHAELSVDERTRVRLGAGATLVAFAPAAPPPAGTQPSGNCTLQRGSARVTVPDGARFALDTPGGATVTVLPGEAMVTVDAARVVRVAVYRGRVRVRAGNREVAVRSGLAVRADPGFPPQLPRPLLAAPAWFTAPPRRVFSRGNPVDVSGVFGIPPGRASAATPVAQWRVQLARDERFTDLVQDRVVGAGNTRFEARALPGGNYFARAIAIDGDHIEGAPGAVAPITIAAPHVIPGGNGRRAMLEIPAGLSCGLNGARPSTRSTPIPLAPGRAHTLRCTGGPGISAPFEIAINAEQAGPLAHQVSIEPAGFSTAGGMRVLVLRLADGAGLPVSYATIQVSASEGAMVDAPRETETRGVYTGTLQWRTGVTGVRLRFTINGEARFDEVFGTPPP